MKQYKISEELRQVLMVIVTQRATGTLNELQPILKALQDAEEIKSEEN